MKALHLITILSLSLLLTSPGVHAFWRLLCKGTLGIARIDPIVNFGEIAPHAHVFAGASNIGFVSDAANLMASNCTSCEVAQDRSVYWTPALYFQHSNGSYELVPTTGGMTVYYFNDNVGFLNDTNGHAIPAEPLTAFPPNFRMMAGNTRIRNFPYPNPDPPMSEWTANDTTQNALAAKATGFNCLNYTNGFKTEGAMEFHYLRNKTYLDAECLNGVRFELEFPSCWDGVNLDSEDHRSHILYPELIKTGVCPDGYNVRTPVMFFETIWLTNTFVNFAGQFVIANGDTEGYGYHGDFYSGWNQSFLQQAVNQCTNGSGLLEDCSMFDLQPDAVSTNCFLNMPSELQDEDYQGPMSALPGNVPIAMGPGLAAKLEGTPVIGLSTQPLPTTNPGASDVFSDISNSVPPYNATTFSASASLVASLPLTTLPPTTDAGETLEIVSTSTFTTDGHEVHMIIYEEVITLTQSSVVAAKRVPHKHGHRHGSKY